MARNEKSNSKPREVRPPAFIAFHVEEKGKNAYWTRIGAAWRHEKGDGLTLQLDLMPVSGGKVILRVPKANEPSPEVETSPETTEEAGA